jgi:hypothetical protein
MSESRSVGMKAGLQTAAIVVLALVVGLVTLDLIGVLIYGLIEGIGIRQILWRVSIVALCLATIASLVNRQWSR